MALAVAPASALAAFSPGPGTVAVVAPHGDDGGFAREFNRLGWDCVAVVLPNRELPAAHRDRGAGTTGYSATVTHTGMRRTVKKLAGRTVDLVVPGSGTGVHLADRLSLALGLPGNDLYTSFVRTDRAIQSAALGDAGIASVPSIRSAGLTRALSWIESTCFPSYVVAAADSSATVRPVVCSTPDEVAEAWHGVRGAARYQAGSDEVVIQQHIAGPQYLVHTVSGSIFDDHRVSSIWTESRTGARLHDRSELVHHRNPLFRALSLYALRVLPVLGIDHGSARLRVAWSDEQGPVLVSARAYAQPTPADDYCPTVSHIAATARAATTAGPDREAGGTEHAVMRVSLMAPGDCVLDAALLRTITALPTVAHVVRLAEPGSRLRRTRDRASSPGELVLAGPVRAVEEDYQVIRSAEQLGLYGTRSR